MSVAFTAPTVRSGGIALIGAIALVCSTTVAALALPEIRLHASNRVPSCVSPERLMRFLTDRNPDLHDRYRDIAALYERHGEANDVRWDYAFYQMILETNYLKFRNGSGRGDVNARQNNFAGIGTTGGGVPGDSFGTVSQGVLAQIQHLVVYSGERLENPIARRTRDVQDDVANRSKALGRPVTFRDLARRWATDRRYGANIELIASRFRMDYCAGKDPEPQIPRPIHGDRVAATGRKPTVARTVESATFTLTEPPRLAPRPVGCRVFTASYGGERAVLVRSVVGDEWHYTALQVIEGEEERLAGNFIRAHARGGNTVDAFASREAALERAFALCPSHPSHR